MSNTRIQASVGRTATNRPPDVALVQNLLLARGFGRTGTGRNATDADGVCGRHTVASILDFQANFMARPDGRVDPDGMSWRTLSGTYQGITAEPPPPAVATGAYTRTVPRPSPASLNPGLTPVSNRFMLQHLGDPREGSYSALCQVPTLPRLRRHLKLESVGPFRVTGLAPAVDSLKAVMADIAAAHPQLYAGLRTSGMLCCRWVRGSTQNISNHAWGTAIDMRIDDVLDVYGNDQVQLGLTLIAPIFNRHGWFWGAAFRTEDGMHFEASESLLRQWLPQLS